MLQLVFQLGAGQRIVRTKRKLALDDENFCLLIANVSNIMDRVMRGVGDQRILRMQMNGKKNREKEQKKVPGNQHFSEITNRKPGNSIFNFESRMLNLEFTY